MTNEQFVLLVTVPIKAGCEDEYLALVNAVNDEMRQEPTFVNTVLHRGAEDPGLFMLHETWRVNQRLKVARFWAETAFKKFHFNRGFDGCFCAV